MAGRAESKKNKGEKKKELALWAMELPKMGLPWLSGSWLDSLMSNKVSAPTDASPLAGAFLLILLCTVPPVSQ